MKDSRIRSIIRYFHNSNQMKKLNIDLNPSISKKKWTSATPENVHIGDIVKIKKTNISGIIISTPVKTLGISNNSIKFKKERTDQDWSQLWGNISPWRNLKNIKVLQK